jgi:hypothetical protein
VIALRAGHEAREVELAREAVEPVAAGLAPVPRVVLRDRAGVLAQDHRQPSVDRALERRRPRAAHPLQLVDRPEPRGRAVGEHDLELVHVVDRGPVDDRVAAGGVVADHAAERGPVGGRGVGAEPEPVARGRAVEVLLHDAGADAHAPCREVDLADRVQMPRGVEHEPLAGRLAREARARAAGHDRHVEAGRRRHGRGDIGGVAREGDEQGRARVQARVAREQVARVSVRAHLATQLAFQLGGQLSATRLPPCVFAQEDV